METRMKFDVVKKEALILDPANALQPRAIPVEVRTDPLTGRTARICHFMRLQWKKPDLEKLVAGTDTPTFKFPGKTIPGIDRAALAALFR